MKRLAIAQVLLLLLVLPARAEKPTPAPTRLGLDPSVASSDLKVTPEMWFYDQQMRQYQDPKMILRQKAEARAEQRTRRIESMRWFGLSNSRPTVNADPFNGDYGPRWTSNSHYYPSRWNGVNYAVEPR
jgi:hypothetical protein